MTNPQEQPESESPAQTGTDPGEDRNSHEALTVFYERLRHSTDSEELHEFARRPLPDRSDQAAFSRFTALLEAVAGNDHTPVDDRVFLAETMPFPNILVKLSKDADPKVRQAVASNRDDKNWLVGILTKDGDPQVRAAALTNPMASWKMRLEGAQASTTDADTLDYLGGLGTSTEEGAPMILASMVRRAVALNPNTPMETVKTLAQDDRVEVANAAQKRLDQ
ncbi:AbrB family transcriptional regulator [Bifidobacterium indicum]|nr:AbrB family transcriptional regulator [Bifidobacterium indicum]PXY80657.1 AbrB family transcriptional regulator [Bifidobacterium indicum]